MPCAGPADEGETQRVRWCDLRRPGPRRRQILIDLANRRINLLVDDTEPAARHAAQDAQRGKPVEVRPRKVTTALKRYALLATSADKGVVHATLSSRV
ncbi:dihydroxy-acid dehydratase [Xanthomonas translucens pv. secalis]|nr:dihydroxy-acid dehydratase [Xanthomonas translucens]UKE43752.1 dihydroxy-acid dehydratase [Xanthomonas translucens pv. secalis]